MGISKYLYLGLEVMRYKYLSDCQIAWGSMHSEYHTSGLKPYLGLNQFCGDGLNTVGRLVSVKHLFL